MNIFQTDKEMLSYIKLVKRAGVYPFFREIEESFGSEVQVDGKRSIMVASNDYLGLSQEPRVLEASTQALRRWGAGPGGSRFLCGNSSIIEELEETVAILVGKKRAVVFATGFMANTGTFVCQTGVGNMVLYDRESHASIIEGANRSKAKMVSFPHNNVDRARKHLASFKERNPRGERLLVTEGVFSMSGSVAELPSLVALKQSDPDFKIFLDDAHGLGVMGNGKGTAAHFGVTDQVDIIMGTFSKALASVGGFIASDDIEWLECLQNKSRTLIFSAALPAASAAAALESCKIICKEPERVQLLWDRTEHARKGFHERGVEIVEGEAPVIGVLIGDEMKSLFYSRELLKRGVFALPAVYPAVARGKAIIRVAFTSTHTHSQVDQVLDVFKAVNDLEISDNPRELMAQAMQMVS